MVKFCVSVSFVIMSLDIVLVSVAKMSNSTW